MLKKVESMPMKRRAFPQSFWQQPNKTLSISPGIVFEIVPSTLLSREENDPIESKKPVLEENNNVSQPNIDLLFSLFQEVEKNSLADESVTLKKLRRGRPKKVKATSKATFIEDDPYLTHSVTETINPEIIKEIQMKTSLFKSYTQIEKIPINYLMDYIPSTQTIEVNSSSNNYSQILSDLVVHL